MMTIRAMILATAMGLAGLSGMAHANQAPAVVSGHMSMATDGEVRKVDTGAGKITIKHDPIQHMDMPGMTMVFTAKDKALLDKVKVGDKIRFLVSHEDGKMLVTDIQPGS